MDYTVNQQNIQKYAERLTNDLCLQFFINKAFISGAEILTFNSENQLNLLIIKNIFLNWQKEALKLKSPYFDYENEVIKQSLKSFMDKLSNHIKVYRYDFEPIVQRSISDFILLAAAPQEFFKKETESLAGPKISVVLLKDFAKYIKINRFVIDQVIRDIEASGYTETFGGETIRFVLKAINENPDKIENPDKALNGLFEQLPADVIEFVCLPKPLVTRPSFLDDPKVEAIVQSPVSIPEPKVDVAAEVPAFIPDPIMEVENPVLVEEPENIEIEEPVAELEFTNEVQEEELPVVLNNDVVETVEESTAQETETDQSEEEEVAFQKVEPIIKAAKSKVTKSEAFEMTKDPINLNEALRISEDRQILAQTLQVKSVSAPFKTLVPMHYRFTFINSLFGGNQQAWAEAVDKIDQSPTYEEAISMLKNEFAEKFMWDKEEDNVAILFNYVERKF